jgi:hypothetical protein
VCGRCSPFARFDVTFLDLVSHLGLGVFVRVLHLDVVLLDSTECVLVSSKSFTTKYFCTSKARRAWSTQNSVVPCALLQVDLSSFAILLVALGEAWKVSEVRAAPIMSGDLCEGTLLSFLLERERREERASEGYNNS